MTDGRQCGVRRKDACAAQRQMRPHAVGKKVGSVVRAWSLFEGEWHIRREVFVIRSSSRAAQAEMRRCVSLHERYVAGTLRRDGARREFLNNGADAGDVVFSALRGSGHLVFPSNLGVNRGASFGKLRACDMSSRKRRFDRSYNLRSWRPVPTATD